MKNLCVYGSSSNALYKLYYEEARALGQRIASAGYGLVFGAGDEGLMGACARGVHDEGGFVTGVIPQFMNAPGVAYESCDELIVTHTMKERKHTMEILSEGFIALPGGVGTFEELLEIITLKQLGQHTKPIVILNTKDYYAPLLQLFDQAVRESFMTQNVIEHIFVARTPFEAVSYFETLVPPADQAGEKDTNRR